MFYLKEFFGTIWDLKGRGLFFLTATLLLAVVTTFRTSVNTGLTTLAPEAWARPYFTALFDSSIQREDVLSEISNRPEVAEVQALADTEAGGVLGRLLTQMGADYQGKAQDVAAFGVRVILKNNAMLKPGRDLLKGLEQSFGVEHMTTSGVRTPRVGSLFQSHPLFQYLAKFGYLGVIVPVALVWALAFALCFPHFTRRAWLVERYQRRSYVRAKTTATGLAIVAGAMATLSLALQGPDLFGLALCVACFSIPWTATMREVKWRVQN